jgi:RNA-dependent RNA polymerase
VILQILLKILDAHERTRFPCRLLHAMYSHNRASTVLERVPDHCIVLPRVMLTPCRTIVVGLEIEIGNRFTRTFTEQHKFPPTSFLRMQLSNEDGQKLFFRDMSNSLIKKFSDVILSGIKINGRIYHFMTYSVSQIKEGSMWLVCPEHRWTIGRIRQEFGDLSSCKSPSAYAARIGQWLSSTMPARIDSSNNNNKVMKAGHFPRALRHAIVDDIKVRFRDKDLYHTDGTGLISESVLRSLILSQPSCPKNINNASIIQVRYGGAKGTLVSWTQSIVNQCANVSSGGEDVDLVLRKPSMVKFDAKFEHLEICRIGTRVPYYLNRNVIFLLVHHGVRDSVFLKMQKKMLADLDAMLKSHQRAEKILPRLSIADVALKDTLLLMLRSGVSPSKDPFIYSCLNSIRTHHIYGLLKKARIFVQKGAVLLGGLDEVGCLPEGCVFFQISNSENDDDDNSYSPFVGPVMITKHPVMHPGDVRMLLAVDVPQLRDKRNVLLFSKKGNHPEPDKMAGSDLDGDEFAITWDNRLFLNEWNGCEPNERGEIVARRQGKGPPLVLDMKDIARNAAILGRANFPPLWIAPSRTPGLPLPKDETVLSKRLVEHFFNYQKDDVLGQLGMLWQDYAASHGAGSKECTELAELYSIAVDFAKSGKPAKIPQKLCFSRNRPRAHWRELPLSPSFHCNSIIGRLYDEALRYHPEDIAMKPLAVAGRKVDKYGQILCIFDYDCDSVGCLNDVYDSQLPLRLGLRLDHVNHGYLQDLQIHAIAQRRAYESMLVALMNRHGIRSEGEVLTGCIRKYHKTNKRRQYEISQIVRQDCRHVCKEFRTEFFREVLRRIQRISSGSLPHDDVERTRSDQNLEEVLRRNAIYNSLQFSGYLSSMKPENIDKEYIDWVKINATKAGPVLFREDFLARMVSRHMAAAYYQAAYAPICRWSPEDDKQIYFSFPWLVADVIFHETAEQPEPQREHRLNFQLSSMRI